MRIAPELQFSSTTCGWRSRSRSSQARWARLCAEQAGADAERVPVGAGAGCHVVVELEEADAELVDQPVDRGVEVGLRRRVAQVEVVAVVLDDPPAVALQERRVGQFGGDRAAHADHLGLEPQPDPMPASRMASTTRCRPRGEPGRRRLPGADAVPPVAAVSSYQPASMQKYSAPTRRAASISGSSFSVVGSPIRVFM